MRRAGALAALACALIAAACGDDGNARRADDGISGDVTVFAAASLTDAFTAAADLFEDAHPGTDVEFNFAGSPTLRTQLVEGARADILATADEANMDAALDAGVVPSRGAVFARNRLVIIVPGDNPGNVLSASDLAQGGLKLVLAAPEVPAGRYAREALDKMDASGAFGGGFAEAALDNVVSEEPNVKAVVAKVQLGEADAGIVYATDVTPEIAGEVTTVPIDEAYNVVAMYPIAQTTEAANPEAAQAFIDFILSDEGQRILEDHGFIGR